MAREPKSQESEEAPGAPEWMVTFSDCMTLLLTFFVLLLSFSSFDDRVFRNLKSIYSRAFTSIAVVRIADRDALLDLPPLRYIIELDKGSEKPTTIRGQEENLMKEQTPVDLERGMALQISSKEVFFGQGKVLSSEGRRTMDLIGALLKKVPSRVVISETGFGADQNSVNFGLPRAWVVMEYLITNANLSRERFSISQASSVPQGDDGVDSTGLISERKVEVVLLERSIYN